MHPVSWNIGVNGLLHLNHQFCFLFFLRESHQSTLSLCFLSILDFLCSVAPLEGKTIGLIIFSKPIGLRLLQRHREVQSRKHFLQKWKGGISNGKKQMAAFLQVYRFQTWPKMLSILVGAHFSWFLMWFFFLHPIRVCVCSLWLCCICSCLYYRCMFLHVWCMSFI